MLYENKFLKDKILKQLKFYKIQIVTRIVWKISDKIDDKSEIIERKSNY